ncbi:hypothetical protein JTB14_029285 [Gonioctena quinquepunctata]|nr:hypothetical protein JTB14_029285 [Gonioctena quinquepunctata]
MSTHSPYMPTHTIICKYLSELQRLFLHTYLSCESKEEGTRYEQFDQLYPQVKNFYCRISKGSYKRKRGRGVPVLFSKDVQEHISVLLSVRNKQVDDKNPYLFGKPGLVTPITGYKVLQSYARASGAKNPSSITCTKLRKHLATSQLFSLNETEIDQLATFMGHTIGVHKNSYRLPDDLHQTAKISKILLLLESGNLGEYKGKTLDEIDINLNEDLLDSINECSDEDDNGKDDSLIEHDMFLHDDEQIKPVEDMKPIV